STVQTSSFSSRRRHTRFSRDWSSDVCSSDLGILIVSSVGFAILMSILDDYPADDGAFMLVVSFFILAIGGSFALLLRWAFKGRRRSRRERSRDEAAMNGSGRGRRAGFSTGS